MESYVPEKKMRGSDLVFPEFDDIKVSTKTFTAHTNLILDLKHLSEALPITPFVAIPRRRGRKKKEVPRDPNKDVSYGSFITVSYMGQLRGVDLKSRNPDAPEKPFRNSFTIVLVLDKHINFKLSHNGTFQMTGCKTHKHAEMCVKTVWDFLKTHPDLYTLSRGECLEALFVPAMRNIDFSLGFKVDREKLDYYLATQTQFRCLLEASFGYTGVNVKIPLEKPITEMYITKVKLKDIDEEWNDGTDVPYQEYLNLLPPKEQMSKVNTQRFNTFLVFHSGTVIVSGICASLQRSAYYYFLDIIRTCYEKVEERLDTTVMTPEELCAELSRESEDECENEVGHCVGYQ